jgi:hypothetical protein
MVVKEFEIYRLTLDDIGLVPNLKMLKRISETEDKVECELIEPMEFTPSEEIEICENCNFDSQIHPMTPTPGDKNSYTKLCILDLVRKKILRKAPDSTSLSNHGIPPILGGQEEKEMAKKIDPEKTGLETGSEMAVNGGLLSSAGDMSPQYYDRETGKPLPLEYINERIVQTGVKIGKLSVQMILDLWFVHLNWFGEYQRADSFKKWVEASLPISYSYTYDIIKIVDMLFKYTSKYYPQTGVIQPGDGFEELVGKVEKPIREYGMKRLKLIAQVVDEKKDEVLDGIFSGAEMSEDEILAVNNIYYKEREKRWEEERIQRNKEWEEERSRNNDQPLGHRDAPFEEQGETPEAAIEVPPYVPVNIVRENEKFKVEINEPEDELNAILFVSAKGENPNLEEIPVGIGEFVTDCTLDLLDAVAEAVLETLTENEGRAFKMSGE